MKTITSAILPRRRRLTNDSTNAKTNTTPSKLSISEELPVRHLRRLHSGSTTTIDSTTAVEENTGVYDTKGQGSVDLDYGLITDTYLNEGIPVAKASSASLCE
ncbi:hypothetical protein GGI08_008513, partial [Coemansia sp. S2]